MSSALYFIENVTSHSGKYNIVDLTKNSIVRCKSKFARIRSSRIIDAVETSARRFPESGRMDGRKDFVRENL